MSDDLTVLGPDGIRRSYDEHYDTMMDVEQDPTGAHEAIQRQHSRIEELEAQVQEGALQYLSDTGQMSETIGDLTRRHEHALRKIDVLEDQLAKAVEAGVDVAASLNAAISILERGGKKAAASDKMFAQMLVDYKASLDPDRLVTCEDCGHKGRCTCDDAYDEWRAEQ